MSRPLKTDEHWQRADDLFQRALALPRAERSAWLAAEAGEDGALRARVEQLLAAAELPTDSAFVPGGALAGALGEDLAGQLVRHRGLTPGARLGPYEIVEEIGRGGMAVVYRARRAEGGFEQQVALKVIKRGTDTEEVLSRFTQERQILASLEHPSIARLYGGGSTAEGQPYFTMELVEGEPIDRYCARRDLRLEQRLRLFFHVGRAVEHAHHNLVVHRDIKPSNVLVTAEGHVKLLDFGIAKLIDPDPWPAAAPATRTHLRLLTPEYASPEQIKGQPVTTATDVYQLGLLLYELLTGKRPFALAGRSPTELEELICNQPPPAPSTALSVVTGSLESRAEGLSSRLRRRLVRRLKGDLDNIVLKALAKEPERRYSGAGALVDELERFLDGRPVAARPASLAYRASKFARRHAWSLGATATLLVVATGLTTVYTAGLARARTRAEQEAERADRVSRFLGSVLAAADPRSSRSGPLTARSLVDEGLKRIDTELADQPDTQATTLMRLGEIYRNLGDFTKARACFERALALRVPLYGEESLQVAESRHRLGASLRTHNLPRARELLEAALAVRRAQLGNNHPDVALCQLDLATALWMAGENEGAHRHLDEGYAALKATLGVESPEVAEALFAQAFYFNRLQRYAEGIELLQRALNIQERAFGATSAQVIQILDALVNLHLYAGEPAAARPYLERAQASARSSLDPDDPLLSSLSFHESKILRHEGRLDLAYDRLEDALARAERLHGATSASTLTYLEEKVRLLKWMKKPAEALAVSLDYLGRMEHIFGADSPHLSADLIEQADLLRLVGRQQEARAVFDRGLALGENTPPRLLPQNTLLFHARLADDLHHPRAAELHARAEAGGAQEH